MEKSCCHQLVKVNIVAKSFQQQLCIIMRFSLLSIGLQGIAYMYGCTWQVFLCPCWVLQFTLVSLYRASPTCLGANKRPYLHLQKRWSTYCSAGSPVGAQGCWCIGMSEIAAHLQVGDGLYPLCNTGSSSSFISSCSQDRTASELFYWDVIVREKEFVLSGISLTQQSRVFPHHSLNVLHRRVLLKTWCIALSFSNSKLLEPNRGVYGNKYTLWESICCMELRKRWNKTSQS